MGSGPTIAQSSWLLGAALDALRSARRRGRAGPAASVHGQRARHIIRYDHPALLVRDGRCDLPDAGPWRALLARHRPRIDRAIAGVGRFESPDMARRASLGTGWLVRPDVVVTNSHLALFFAERARSAGMRVRINFLGEHAQARTSTFAVRELLYAAEDHDLAFLRIDTRERIPLPPSAIVPLAERPVARGSPVCTIGFPADNTRFYDAEQTQRIFAGIFDVKRVAPGTILDATSARIDHDCTTLGGNSGSVLLELASGHAVGLHADGEAFVANHAVPAAVIRERLAALGR